MGKKRLQQATFSMFQRVAETTENQQQRHVTNGFVAFQGRRIDQIDGIDITAPLMVENVHILRFRGGEVTINANLMPYTLREGDFVLIGPGTIYQIELYTSSTVCDILVIDIDTARRALSSAMPDFLNDAPVFLTATLTSELLSIYDGIFANILNVATAGLADTPVATSLLSAAIHYMATCHQAQTDTSPASRQQEIFIRFLRLVNQHCRQQRQIGYYADRMALSQDHLSHIVRQHSGVTCKEWIERAVLMEAKVMLKHSDRSITDISDSLGFHTDSFFCKYFKRLTGMTPCQYRKS